ncbi:MAG: hypothetical protein U0470_04985 [Anaerolineae bacterium]
MRTVLLDAASGGFFSGFVNWNEGVLYAREAAAGVQPMPELRRDRAGGPRRVFQCPYCGTEIFQGVGQGVVHPRGRAAVGPRRRRADPGRGGVPFDGDAPSDGEGARVVTDADRAVTEAMMTPWSTPAAGADAPQTGRNDRSDRPSQIDGRGLRGPRPSPRDGRSARAAVAEALRAARDTSSAAAPRDADGGARRRGAPGGRPGPGAVADRPARPALSSGAWFDGARARRRGDWLAATDALLALVDELAARSPAPTTARWRTRRTRPIAELRGQFDTRRDALAAAAWSRGRCRPAWRRSCRSGRSQSDGAPRQALEVMRYARGDVAALLDDGIIVWEDAASLPAGARIAFEPADGVTVPLPPPPALTLADDGFRLSFHDDGAGNCTAPSAAAASRPSGGCCAGTPGAGWLARGGEGTGAGGGAASVGAAPAAAGADSAAAWRGAGVDGRT